VCVHVHSSQATRLFRVNHSRFHILLEFQALKLHKSYKPFLQRYVLHGSDNALYGDNVQRYHPFFSLRAKLLIIIKSPEGQSIAERPFLFVNKQADAQTPSALCLSALNARETDDRHRLFDRSNKSTEAVKENLLKAFIGLRKVF